MASTQPKPATKPKSTHMESEEEIQVPLIKKQSIPDSKMTCQVHSLINRKELIKYINMDYFTSKDKDNQKPFLCDICLAYLRRKNPSAKIMANIKTSQQFERQYIEPVFKKYVGPQAQNIPDTQKLLQNAETQFINEIDKTLQFINRQCETYKQIFKQIFDTLRDPLKAQNIEKLRKGEFTEEIITEFYKNHLKVQSYSALAGIRNKELIQHSIKALKASMKEVKEQFRQNLIHSQEILKFYIKNFQDKSLHQQLNNMVDQQKQKNQLPKKSAQQKRENNHLNSSKSNSSIDLKNLQKNNDQSKTNIFQIMKKIKEIKDQEKEKEKEKEKQKQTEKQKEKEKKIEKNNKMSAQPSERKREAPNSDKKKLPKEQGQKRIIKRRVIIKERKEKPYRRSNVVMLSQHMQLTEMRKFVRYMVFKVQTGKIEEGEIHAMPSTQFKRKYPQAYKDFQKNIWPKKQTQKIVRQKQSSQNQ